jgi:transposase
MSGSRRYPPELRERAVRMVLDHRGDYPSVWKAVCAISEQIGVHHETLRLWVHQAETDAGNRPGLTTDERKRLRELEQENRELKRANEILKAASIVFATELDGRPKKS